MVLLFLYMYWLRVGEYMDKFVFTCWNLYWNEAKPHTQTRSWHNVNVFLNLGDGAHALCPTKFQENAEPVVLYSPENRMSQSGCPGRFQCQPPNIFDFPCGQMANPFSGYNRTLSIAQMSTHKISFNWLELCRKLESLNRFCPQWINTFLPTCGRYTCDG